MSDQLTSEEKSALISRLIDEKERALRLLEFACPTVKFSHSDAIDRSVALVLARLLGNG